MADRYWVGGSGNWDASTTTNWSTASGGSGGASAPTSADNVFFDASSDAGAGFTVTISTGAVCANVTISGLDQVMTLAGSATWAVHGSLSFPATNLTRTFTGAINFLGSGSFTITTNGVTLTTGAVTFNNASGTWTLGSALTTGGTITLTTGTLDVSASNFSITCTSWTKTGGTYNEQLGTLSLSAASPTFAGGTDTYYNVSFTSTSAGTATITGANTFNNLTFTSLAATGIRNISIGENQTVNGTLTFGTANTAIRRMFVFSLVTDSGTQRTITVNGSIATLADVDFRDIVAAGTAGTWSGTRLGNCLGNSNITFDAGKTVYRVGAGNWSATQWSLSSGGAVDVNNFPLAQDNCVFDNNTATGTLTVDISIWNVGNLNFNGLTSAVTFNTSGGINIYKNVILSSNLTMSGTAFLYFLGQGTTQQITSAGRTFTQGLAFRAASGTCQLQDALVTSQGVVFDRGTLDLNNFDLTCLTFSSSNTNTRSIAFGTKAINVTGNNTTVVAMQTATNFTYTGTPTFNLTYSGGTGTRNCNFGSTAGGSESNAIDVNITSGTDDCRTTGDFRNINYTGFSGVSPEVGRRIYGNVVFSSTMSSSGTSTAITFQKSSGTQTLRSNGYVLDSPLTKTSSGILQLLDSLSLGATRSITLTNGTLDLNGFNITTNGFVSTGSSTRQLNFGTGNLNISASGAAFTVSGSNFSTAGTGSVSMNSASSKTFAGGGFSYKVLNQGGAGELIITGANTFTDITNTNATASTITFPNTTTTVSNFSAEGTVGNLLTLRRTGASGTFELAYVGTSRVDSDYLSISNSTASPSNTWYAGNNSTDGGGNTGWTFTAAPPLVDSTTQRLAEAGSVIVAQSKQTSTASRLGGAGQIEADIVRYKSEFSTKVSGLTVKGRLINKARE